MRVFVAGHRGMVGSAVCRHLRPVDDVYTYVLPRQVLDFAKQPRWMEAHFRQQDYDAVIYCAAKVGGIHANATRPADFFYENAAATINTIKAAFDAGITRFLFLGSTCIYPRLCPQPMKEADLLTGQLEPTNEGYAIAKIAGLKYCQFLRQQHGVNYHSVMPTNLYGPGDNYTQEESHVLPALIRRFHEAKQSGAESVTIWGNGEPRRDFLHVDDLADAIVKLLDIDNPPDWVNVGSGGDVRIRDLASLVADTVGFRGEIKIDTARPYLGPPTKIADISLIRSLGWHPTIQLADGVRRTYEAFKDELNTGTLRMESLCTA